MPARQQESRLVKWSHFSAPSLLGHRFIQIQDQARDAGVCSQFFDVQLLVLLRVAVIQKICGRFPVAAVAVLKSFQRVEYHLDFGGSWWPRQHHSVQAFDSLVSAPDTLSKQSTAEVA